jgi:hypothetical protein
MQEERPFPPPPPQGNIWQGTWRPLDFTSHVEAFFVAGEASFKAQA